VARANSEFERYTAAGALLPPASSPHDKLPKPRDEVATELVTSAEKNGGACFSFPRRRPPLFSMLPLPLPLLLLLLLVLLLLLLLRLRLLLLLEPTAVASSALLTTRPLLCLGLPAMWSMSAAWPTPFV
jgi:hypothetical protein